MKLAAIIFTLAATVSLPGGLYLCWLGLNGRFIDAAHQTNVLSGVAFLVLAFVPVALAVAGWTCQRADRAE